MSNNQFDPLYHFNQIVEQAQEDGTFKSDNIPAHWEVAAKRAELAKRQHEKQALDRRMRTLEQFHKLLAGIENAAETGESEFRTAVSEMANFCTKLAKPSSKTRSYLNGSKQSAETYSSGRPIPRLRKLFDGDEGVAIVAFFRRSEKGQLYLGDRSNKRNIWFNADESVLDNTVFPHMRIPQNGRWVGVPSKRDEFEVEWERVGRNIRFVRLVGR